MKKMLTILCSAAVLASVSNFAFAEGKEFRGKNLTPEQKAQMEQKRAEFDARLNLTPEQKEKMKDFHQESKAKIEPIFAQIKVEKAKMKQLKESGASENEINIQMKKIHKLREDMKAIRKANFEQIQTILTPEQQKEFNKMHEEHKNNGGFKK